MPTAERDTSSLLVRGPDGWTLVDCPGSIVNKLARRGVRIGGLRRIVITHDHVDHVYGFPHLVHAAAIAGVAALRVHAPAQTVATLDAMVEVHGLDGDWYPRIELRPIVLQQGVEVSHREGMVVTAAPAAHGRDAAALRFEIAGAAFCHSSDTRPSNEVAALARSADILLHDCAGLHAQRETFAENHSSAREAGEVAAAAGAGRLVLMHLGPADDAMLARYVEEAAAAFGGRVTLAADGECYRLETSP